MKGTMYIFIVVQVNQATTNSKRPCFQEISLCYLLMVMKKRDHWATGGPINYSHKCQHFFMHYETMRSQIMIVGLFGNTVDLEKTSFQMGLPSIQMNHFHHYLGSRWEEFGIGWCLYAQISSHGYSMIQGLFSNIIFTLWDALPQGCVF